MQRKYGKDKKHIFQLDFFKAFKAIVIQKQVGCSGSTRSCTIQLVSFNFFFDF
jgi:hypothetical protein